MKLAEVLNEAGLPGVRFVPIQFTPTFSVHKGKLCKGVHILLTDRDRCNVVDVGLLIAETLYRLVPEGLQPRQDAATCCCTRPRWRRSRPDKPLKEIRALWQKDLDEFQQRRAKYLIY